MCGAISMTGPRRRGTFLKHLFLKKFSFNEIHQRYTPHGGYQDMGSFAIILSRGFVFFQAIGTKSSGTDTSEGVCQFEIPPAIVSCYRGLPLDH